MLKSLEPLDSWQGTGVDIARFVAMLLLGFAASAALLAGLGIYRVVSYMVSQRRREFGLRLVLGAEGHDLVLSTVRRSVWLVGRWSSGRLARR
jgi:putative ABC transport system permease protein